MDTQTATPAAGEALPATPGPDIQSDNPARAAAQALAARRWKRDQPEPQPEPASAEPAAPAEIPPQEESADPPQGAPGETTQAAEPAELPPIEPPRSWTTDEKDRFKTYPRELQAYLSEREQERDRDLRRRQNEAADKLKAVEADQQAAQKARQEYEAVLPQLLQFVQQQMAGEYADVKTWADVERMAVEDPIRHSRWQVQQQKIAALNSEMAATQQRQAQEQSDKWTKFSSEQDKLFAEKAPDSTDPVKGPKLRESAGHILRDLGFTDQELGAAWNGQGSLSLRDHRVQLLILDAVQWRDAKEKARVATPKSVPPPQRPGTAQQKPSASDALQALNQRLNETGKPRDAAALILARRAASRR